MYVNVQSRSTCMKNQRVDRLILCVVSAIDHDASLIIEVNNIYIIQCRAIPLQKLRYKW